MAPKLSAAQLEQMSCALGSSGLGTLLELIDELGESERTLLAKLLKAPAKPRGIGAEAFFDMYQNARRRAAERYTARWVTLGLAVNATIPSGLRSFRTARGVKITLPGHAHIPPADCWPGGVLPAELVSVPACVSNGGPMGDAHPYVVMVSRAVRDQRIADGRPEPVRKPIHTKTHILRAA